MLWPECTADEVSFCASAARVSAIERTLEPALRKASVRSAGASGTTAGNAPLVADAGDAVASGLDGGDGLLRLSGLGVGHAEDVLSTSLCDATGSERRRASRGE